MLHKHISEIEALPARELNRWVAFFRVHPMPDLYVAAAVPAHATAMSTWSGNGRPPALADYVLELPPPPETDEERVERLKRHFGVRDNGQGQRS